MIATSEKDVTVLDAVAWYRELLKAEHGFRSLKDVLALQPIYHRVEPRVKAPFVLVQPELEIRPVRVSE